MDDMCEDHQSKFKGIPHPDAKHKPSQTPEHKRGVGLPAKHTSGKMPSQLNPQHGPHR